MNTTTITIPLAELDELKEDNAYLRATVDTLRASLAAYGRIFFELTNLIRDYYGEPGRGAR